MGPTVVDLDYSQRDLWDYQIGTLERWARFGVDGFRCDVASLVPVPFWAEARRRVAAIRPCLWLAESVHREFVTEARRRGLYCASDAELHEAFDLTYDYDGRAELEAAWAGKGPVSALPPPPFPPGVHVSGHRHQGAHAREP